MRTLHGYMATWLHGFASTISGALGTPAFRKTRTRASTFASLHLEGTPGGAAAAFLVTGRDLPHIRLPGRKGSSGGIGDIQATGAELHGAGG